MALSEWLYSHAADRPTDLRVERVQDRQGSGGGVGYVGTVAGIDVYSGQRPRDRSVLFSCTALRAVTHAKLSDGNFGEVAFHEGDDPPARPCPQFRSSKLAKTPFYGVIPEAAE